MGHSGNGCTGCLNADTGRRDWDELTTESGTMLMEGMKVMGNRGKHINILQHLVGFLKNHLPSDGNQSS